MYGWMHGVCAYRDNLHSHQLLGLRTPPSTHHPCSGFLGSILFARNVTEAKSSWGAAMRTRHRRWRPGGRWWLAQGGSILSFHHKDVEKSPFSLPRLLCIECISMSCVWIQGNFWSFQHIGLRVWLQDEQPGMFPKVTRAAETWAQTLA